MQWNHNMNEAKKTVITKATRQTKKGPVDVDISKPFEIMAAFEEKGETKITRSCWIPDQERWDMFNHPDKGKTQPFAFIAIDDMIAALGSVSWPDWNGFYASYLTT
jgi:hypothetical protein